MPYLPIGQKYRILEMLSDGKWYNGIDIVKRFNFSAPKARIQELQKQGWSIEIIDGEIFRKNGGTITKRTYFDCRLSQKHCKKFKKMVSLSQEKPSFWKNLFINS